ncbi:MAG TPA: 1-deoxy-D-xylulose-5-phosphate synthase, partial [Epsilonproteobacteria bacterium]|nr:1-deoxy-D-xylulose-5-phosphate synthase [Campylobacterota bacterium]
AEDCESEAFELGKSDLLQEGESVLFVGYGNGVGRAIETAKHLDGIDPGILDLRFVKPLDGEKLKVLAQRYSQWFVFSDSARMGGVGSALLEFLCDEQIEGVTVTTFEYEDDFITHGNTKRVEESLGILPEQLALKVKENVNN